MFVNMLDNNILAETPVQTDKWIPPIMVRLANVQNQIRERSRGIAFPYTDYFAVTNDNISCKPALHYGDAQNWLKKKR